MSERMSAIGSCVGRPLGRAARRGRGRSLLAVALAAGALASPVAATAAALPVFAIQTTPALAKLDTFLSGATAISPTDAWVVGESITAHWNGATWTQVAMPDSHASLSDVSAAATDDVWAVGSVTAKDGTSHAIALLWNGQAWSVMPTAPKPGGVPSFDTVDAIAANDVWIAGSIAVVNDNLPLFEHWDGTAWSVTVLNVGETVVQKLSAVSSTDIWAVGENIAPSFFLPFSAHWNGSKWSPVGVPMVGLGSRLLGVAAVASNDVWAVGSATLPAVFFNSMKTSSNNPVETLIEHWDGNAWSTAPSPNIGPASLNLSDHLFAVTALSATDLYAVGNFSLPDGTNTLLPLALHGDGTTWTVQPTPVVGERGALLGAAAAVPSTVWMAGTGHFPALVSGSGPLILGASGG